MRWWVRQARGCFKPSGRPAQADPSATVCRHPFLGRPGDDGGLAGRAHRQEVLRAVACRGLHGLSVGSGAAAQGSNDSNGSADLGAASEVSFHRGLTGSGLAAGRSEEAPCATPQGYRLEKVSPCNNLPTQCLFSEASSPLGCRSDTGDHTQIRWTAEGAGTLPIQGTTSGVRLQNRRASSGRTSSR